ncbi:hypothetical protein ACHAQA_001446 [Verticillium albo-atrum]
MADLDYPLPVSWVDSMAQTCNATQIPKESLAAEAHRFIRDFLTPETAHLALGVSMYFANEALLTSTDTENTYGVRRIVNKPAISFRGVKASNAVIIAVSVLLGVQVLLLVLLVGYIYTLRTWTGTLDAFALLRLGAVARSKVSLPSLSRVPPTDLQELEKVDGLGGLVPGEQRPGQDVEVSDDTPMASTAPMGKASPSSFSQAGVDGSGSGPQEGPADAPSNSPIERGLFYTSSRHVRPSAMGATPAQLSLRLRPSLPAFFDAENPLSAMLTEAPESPGEPMDLDEQPTPRDASDSTGADLYYIPNPPAGTPKGPYDMRNPEHRRALELMGLLPHSVQGQQQDAPAQPATYALPPLDFVFTAHALAEWRAWWDTKRPSLPPILQQLAGRGTEPNADMQSEAWQDISVEEAEEAEEEHIEWEMVWSRERGMVERNKSRRR